MAEEVKTISCPNCNQPNPPGAFYCQNCRKVLQPSELGAEEQIDPLIGKQIQNYKIDRWIGSGGSGSVYQGIHVNLQKKAAIKILRTDLITDEESRERFEREAKVLADLSHQNIVSIEDFGYIEGIGPYMIMEWLDGKTLFEVRKQRKYLDLAEIIAVFEQFTSALSYMHKRNAQGKPKVIHRDLKPENIMVTSGSDSPVNVEDISSCIIKIYDFGIALFSDDARKLTAAGMVVGTPHYMAPEQIIVEAEVDHRADIYAAGAILFELLTGRPPFWGPKKTIEIMKRHIQQQPPRLEEVVPERNLPPELNEVIQKALAKHPDQRYQDARELFDHLVEAVEGRSHPQVETADSDLLGFFSGDSVDEKTVVSPPNIQDLQKYFQQQAETLSDSGTAPSYGSSDNLYAYGSSEALPQYSPVPNGPFQNQPAPLANNSPWPPPPEPLEVSDPYEKTVVSKYSDTEQTEKIPISPPGKSRWVTGLLSLVISIAILFAIYYIFRMMN